MTAAWVGYGSMMTMRSSFSMAFFISCPRVWLLTACPQSTIARTLSRWPMLSLSSFTPSIQRETGMPL